MKPPTEALRRRKRRITIAVCGTLLAVWWTVFFWSKIAGPLLHRGFEGPTVRAMPPMVTVDFEPRNPDGRDAAPAVEEIVGIGAMLRADNDTGLLEVMNTIPGSPAERAGLKAGMLIQKVNDTSLEGRPLAECISMIRGPVGSKVRLEVRDPERNAVLPMELIRERIQVGGP